MYRIASILLLIALTLVGCTKTMPPVKVDRNPATADYTRLGKHIISIPVYDAESPAAWQVDLRSKNLTAIDARASLSDLLHASFDSRTVWPPKVLMPTDFDPQAILELGKDPGLAMRSLHTRGITGAGVGIAIIDQTLLTTHPEYADRLRLCEEIGSNPVEAAMHAPAVASIAVGKTVGVAPGADLYFIACSLGSPDDAGNWNYDFSLLAQSVRRIVRLNDALPGNRKIRVISISVGWMHGQTGYEAIRAAVDEAKKAGIFVVSSSLQETNGLAFDGLGRDPMADPNAFASFSPGLFLRARFFTEDSSSQGLFADRLWIPMDSRTTASPTGIGDYVFYAEGGWSWSIPYIAGMYALACQIKPTLTPDHFWRLARESGAIIDIKHREKRCKLGPILDPVALVAELQSE